MFVKVAFEGIVTEAFERSTTPLKVVVPLRVVLVAERGPAMVVVPFSVLGPEVVNPPFTVVVARFVVPVAVRLLVVMLFELTVARFAVPVAVMLVPVALSNSRLLM
jgi:hypothetical protein